jgi:hypothetical protein
MIIISFFYKYIFSVIAPIIDMIVSIKKKRTWTCNILFWLAHYNILYLLFDVTLPLEVMP